MTNLENDGLLLIRNKFRRPRLTLAEGVGWVVAFALAFKWPQLLLLTAGALLAFLLHRAGLALVWILILVSGIGAILPLLMPPIRVG
jgi:hypothetical protein